MKNWKLVICRKGEKYPEVCIFDDYAKMISFMKKIPDLFPDFDNFSVKEGDES